MRRSRSEIKELLESFARSGLTQQAFCSETGVSVATFFELGGEKPPPGFAAPEGVLRPVRVTDSSRDGPTVRLPGGIEIILPVGSTATESSGTDRGTQSYRAMLSPGPATKIYLGGPV